MTRKKRRLLKKQYEIFVHKFARMNKMGIQEAEKLFYNSKLLNYRIIFLGEKNEKHRSPHSVHQKKSQGLDRQAFKKSLQHKD